MFDCPERTAKEKLLRDKKQGFIHIDELGYQEALELWFEFKDRLKQERDANAKPI